MSVKNQLQVKIVVLYGDVEFIIQKLRAVKFLIDCECVKFNHCLLPKVMFVVSLVFSKLF